MGKATGKSIPGRKSICNDPEVETTVGCLQNRRMDRVVGRG